MIAAAGMVPAGEVAVIWVAESTVKEVALVLPNLTAPAPVKSVPVMVTDAPPAGGPVVGEMLLTVGAVYRFAPGSLHGRRWITPGAGGAVAGWILASKAFALYMAYSVRMNAFYGSLATLLALMGWLYLMALMVLLGARLDREIRPSAR